MTNGRCLCTGATLCGKHSLPTAIIGHSSPTLVFAMAQLSLNTGQLHITCFLCKYADPSIFLGIKLIKTGKKTKSAVHFISSCTFHVKEACSIFLPFKDVVISKSNKFNQLFRGASATPVSQRLPLLCLFTDFILLRIQFSVSTFSN